MTEPSSDINLEICDRVKRMGYARGNRIHLYRENFELLSDPFPEGTGVAVLVKQLSDGSPRLIQLPATLLQSKQKRVGT